MASYVKNLRGYIADVPRAWFKRCDGEIFYYEQLSQCSISPQVNFMEVNGGWSLSPVAFLPGQSTMEASMTQVEFNRDLFAMANKTKFVEDAAYTTLTTERHDIDPATHSITLLNTPVEGTINIRGLKQGTAAAAGVYSVDSENPAKIIFSEDEAGEIEVSYENVVADAQVALMDNKSSAVGQLVLKWPIYSDGKDCTEAAIIGYLVMNIFRVRVTQLPGFDTSLTLYRFLTW